MRPKLKVSFDDPEHGWVGLTINYGSLSMMVSASYTPSDSFLDLTNALWSLLHYEDEATVTWHEGPAETELRFSRSGEEVKLAIETFPDHGRDPRRAERALDACGQYVEICLPFWRALRDLQGRFSSEELEARWHRPWPWKEVDLLTAALKETKDSLLSE